MAKKMTTILITETENIREVRTVWVDEEANALLDTKQWILLHSGVAHRDSGGFQAKVCHVLGRLS